VLASALIVIAAYLIGSISFAVVVSKAFGLPDPHQYGSHNPGATNVLRTGNKIAALLTLVGALRLTATLVGDYAFTVRPRWPLEELSEPL